MLRSIKYSNIVLRFGLAFIFLWFGVDKFVHPDYWINAWYPRELDGFIKTIGLTENESINFVAIFEILIGTSLISGFFMTIFSILGIFLMMVNMVIFGFNEILVRNISIISGLLAIILWPTREI